MLQAPPACHHEHHGHCDGRAMLTQRAVGCSKDLALSPLQTLGLANYLDPWLNFRGKDPGIDGS